MSEITKIPRVTDGKINAIELQRFLITVRDKVEELEALIEQLSE